MHDMKRIAHSNMRALVQWFGCYDAVAETINTRWSGGASKGTISKKMSGHLDWTLCDVIAIEDAVGRHPVTRCLANRLGARFSSASESLVAQSGVIAKETGEAIAAILSAEQSLDAADRAQAIVEIDEAIEALQCALARLDDRLCAS